MMSRYVRIITAVALLCSLGAGSGIDNVALETKGVLDRIEDNGLAVILVEEYLAEVVVAFRSLPAGSDVNTWFNIEVYDGGFEIMAIDWELTQKEARKVSNTMERLRQK